MLNQNIRNIINDMLEGRITFKDFGYGVLGLVYKINHVADIQDYFHGACARGHIKAAKLALKQGAEITSTTHAYAYRGGNDKIISLLDPGANVIYKFRGAVEGGHIELVKSLIDRVNFIPDISMYRGTVELLELLESKHIVDWNNITLAAASFNNRIVINYILERGLLDWNYVLYGACQTQNNSLLDLAIQNKANNFRTALYYACKQNNVKSAKLMLVNQPVEALNDGLEAACSYNAKECADLMVQHGATTCYYCNGSKHKIIKSIYE